MLAQPNIEAGDNAPRSSSTHGRELKILGENIRQRRRLLQVSQEQLADRSGLHRTYLSGVERGFRNLSFCSLVAIARGLQTTVSELAAGVGPYVAMEREAGPAAP